MVIERYSHVMHIVSNVQGEVRDDIDALDVFKATFPAGTLSGAPKIRAMEIIDEVEPVKGEFLAGLLVIWDGMVKWIQLQSVLVLSVIKRCMYRLVQG